MTIHFLKVLSLFLFLLSATHVDTVVYASQDDYSQDDGGDDGDIPGDDGDDQDDGGDDGFGDDSDDDAGDDSDDDSGNMPASSFPRKNLPQKRPAQKLSFQNQCLPKSQQGLPFQPSPWQRKPPQMLWNVLALWGAGQMTTYLWTKKGNSMGLGSPCVPPPGIHQITQGQPSCL